MSRESVAEGSVEQTCEPANRGRRDVQAERDRDREAAAASDALCKSGDCVLSEEALQDYLCFR